MSAFWSIFVRQKLGKVGRSTHYYRTHPKARRKHVLTSKRINARPEQKARRRELGRKNYETDKKYGKSYRKGKDLSHTKNGLRYKDRSANRGSKTDQKGDRNARGGKPRTGGSRR